MCYPENEQKDTVGWRRALTWQRGQVQMEGQALRPWGMFTVSGACLLPGNAATITARGWGQRLSHRGWSWPKVTGLVATPSPGRGKPPEFQTRWEQILLVQLFRWRQIPAASCSTFSDTTRVCFSPYNLFQLCVCEILLAQMQYYLNTPMYKKNTTRLSHTGELRKCSMVSKDLLSRVHPSESHEVG